MCKRKVIGVCPLSNVSSINVYDMIYEDGVAYALAGLNDEEPTKCEILFDKFDGYSLHAVIPYFKVGELEITLSQVTRLLVQEEV